MLAHLIHVNESSHSPISAESAFQCMKHLFCLVSQADRTPDEEKLRKALYDPVIYLHRLSFLFALQHTNISTDHTCIPQMTRRSGKLAQLTYGEKTKYADI